MKKFFSAILLMTMMVFSVGTFVSCNDLVEEVETIKGQTSDIEAQISALETQIAALETALKGEIKSAADQAKAEAIAAAKTECELLKALFEDALASKADTKALEELTALVNAKIAAIEPELAKMATKVELEEAVKELVAKDTELSMQITALEAYKATADSNFVEIEAALAEAEKLQAELKANVEENYTELYNLIGKNAGWIETAFEDIEGLEDAVEEYYTELHNLIGTNASAIGATVEDLTATVEEYYVELYDLIGQNTGFINTAFEEIEFLKGDVKKLQEALAALEPRVKALEEKIEKVDADLKLINTAIKDLANQIQSITPLPGEVKVDSYTYGDVTTLRFLAEYEVSPARLAGELANAKLYFTNVVKGEPATYAAEFVSAKDGRVVVRGKITDKNTPAFQKFYSTAGSTVNPASKVYVALHVDQAKPNTVGEDNVDAGTYVAADFVELTDGAALNLANLVYLYDTEEQVVIANPNKSRIDNYTKTIEIPYTTDKEDATRALFPIDFRVMLEGQFVTLADAAKYFGFTSFEPSYKYEKDTEYKAEYGVYPYHQEKTSNFIKISNDKNVAATAALARTAAKEDINRSATAYITEIKVGGLATNLKVTSTYVITNGKASDIKFADHNVDWSYKMYDAQYDIHEYAIYASANDVNKPEIAVTTPVDITKLTYEGAQTLGSPVMLTANAYYTADGSVVKDANGDPVSGIVAVNFTSSSTARIYGTAGIEFYEKPVTYRADFVLMDANKVEYDASFSINLGARPADKKIDLGNVSAEGVYSDPKGRQIPVNAIKAVMDEDSAFYTDLDFTTLYGTNLGTGTPAATGNTTNVSLNFQKNNIGTDAAPIYTYNAYKLVNNVPVETSYINIPNGTAKYAGEYKLAYEYKFYGVTYTFIANIELKHPSIKLEANSMRVPSNGVIEMHGTYKEPVYNKTDKKFDYAAYALNTINLRELVKINNGGAAFPADEYKIVYTLKTEYFDANDNKVSGSSIATIDYTGNTTDVDSKAIVKWNDKNVNELTYDIQLVSAADPDVKFGDPVTIKLVVPELVTVTGSKKEVVYNNAEKYSVGNFVQGLSIVNKLSGNAIFNEGATFWNNSEVGGYLDATDARATKDDSKSEYNLYNFKYAIDATKITGKLADGTPVDLGEDFKYYAADETLADGSKRHAGDIEIDMNNSGIDQNVEIKIPVTITHDYQGVGDNACEHTVTVTLLFLSE